MDWMEEREESRMAPGCVACSRDKKCEREQRESSVRAEMARQWRHVGGSPVRDSGFGCPGGLAARRGGGRCAGPCVRTGPGWRRRLGPRAHLNRSTGVSEIARQRSGGRKRSCAGSPKNPTLKREVRGLSQQMRLRCSNEAEARRWPTPGLREGQTPSQRQPRVHVVS